MLPAIWNDKLFNDFFDESFAPFEEFERHNPLYGKHARNVMKTDVRETENSYELDIDLPGFKKEDVSVQLENGYLSISAAKGVEKEETDKKGRYIRKERYSGQCSRSFYVGDGVRPEDVNARFEDGILKIAMPKAVQLERPNNTIAIQ